MNGQQRSIERCQYLACPAVLRSGLLCMAEHHALQGAWRRLGQPAEADGLGSESIERERTGLAIAAHLQGYCALTQSVLLPALLPVDTMHLCCFHNYLPAHLQLPFLLALQAKPSQSLNSVMAWLPQSHSPLVLGHMLCVHITGHGKCLDAEVAVQVLGAARHQQCPQLLHHMMGSLRLRSGT